MCRQGGLNTRSPRRVLASKPQGQVPPGQLLYLSVSPHEIRSSLRVATVFSSLTSSTARVPCPHPRFAEQSQRMHPHSGRREGRTKRRDGNGCGGALRQLFWKGVRDVRLSAGWSPIIGWGWGAGVYPRKRWGVEPIGQSTIWGRNTAVVLKLLDLWTPLYS